MAAKSHLDTTERCAHHASVPTRMRWPPMVRTRRHFTVSHSCTCVCVGGRREVETVRERRVKEAQWETVAQPEQGGASG